FSGRALLCSNVMRLVSRSGGPVTCIAFPMRFVDMTAGDDMDDAVADCVVVALRLRDEGCNATDACAGCDAAVLLPPPPPPPPLLELCSRDPFWDDPADLPSSRPSLRDPL